MPSAPSQANQRRREEARSAVCGDIAGGRSRGVSGHEPPRRRFSIAVSTWRPTDIWYSRRYCTRRGSSSAKWWVSGCCVFQTASCAASPTATRKSSSSMLPRSRRASSIGNSPSGIGFSQLFSSAFRVLNACAVGNGHSKLFGRRQLSPVNDRWYGRYELISLHNMASGTALVSTDARRYESLGFGRANSFCRVSSGP